LLVEIETAGCEQLGMIDLRATLAQRHIEPVFLVDAGGDRLVIAAMLGLGAPIGAEGDVIERVRRHRGGHNQRPDGDEPCRTLHCHVRPRALFVSSQALSSACRSAAATGNFAAARAALLKAGGEKPLRRYHAVWRVAGTSFLSSAPASSAPIRFVICNRCSRTSSLGICRK